MANSRIRDAFSTTRSGTSSENITRGLPGITTSDTSTEQLMVQTAQDLVQNLTSFNNGVLSMSAVQQQQESAIQQNTLALEQNTQGRSGGGTAGVIEDAASGLLGGAGLLSPILSGIMSLFGGSSSSTVTTSQPFSLPPPIAVQATVNSSAALTPAAQGSEASSATSVVIQVNAIDSKSFMDHQDEIANAVREAVLHSHPINDVLSQL